MPRVRGLRRTRVGGHGHVLCGSRISRRLLGTQPPPLGRERRNAYRKRGGRQLHGVPHRPQHKPCGRIAGNTRHAPAAYLYPPRTMNTPSLNMDKLMMRRAIQLARHGLGTTSPNPYGRSCDCSTDGRIIGEGWHRAVWRRTCRGQCRGLGSRPRHAARGHNLRDPRTMLPLRTHASMLRKLIIDCGIPRVVVGTTLIRHHGWPDAEWPCYAKPVVK